MNAAGQMAVVIVEPITKPDGLTSGEAENRLRRFGRNETPDYHDSLVSRILSKFFAPVPCLLEAAILLQIYLAEYAEASVLGVLLLFNAIIGLVQENRARATIETLKARLAMVASVQRDGIWRELPIWQIVPGDVIKLGLGTIVPADVRIVSGDVQVDQSLITGESLPTEAGSGSQTFAGAIIRRGEANAEVTATGTRTKFGKTAELVKTARVTSEQQKAIFRVVRNLTVVNSVITAALIAYAHMIAVPLPEFIPLILIAVLATVPVALPATFTLATAIGAQALARRSVLLTRLSAVDEAASMDLLCSDKTGTLTRNELAVSCVQSFCGVTEDAVLALAATASSEACLDPVDKAIRAASIARSISLPPRLHFVPFDSTTKMAEAIIDDGSEAQIRVIKGAFARVHAASIPQPEAEIAALKLEAEGFRVLGVASGTQSPLTLNGLLALSDPPREDAAGCIEDLRRLGVRVMMISGDAAATTATVAGKVGLGGEIRTPENGLDTRDFSQVAAFANVLPEHKFAIVKALQAAGHVVGMCGDGANDAPALRQAQVGIAVSTATDVAKSAAGIVLTDPGLSGIIAAIREGRITFQRILTYTLRSMVHKVRQVLFLAFGLALTGHSILTPMLMVISMITGDFLAMSSTTDHVVPSELPNSWRIGSVTIAGVVMGIIDLLFCMAVLTIGKYRLGLSVESLQTLTLVILVCSGQAIFYVVRERRRIWSSMPSRIVIASSVADLIIIPSLALTGTFMTSIPLALIASVFVAAIAFAFVLDTIKSMLFRHLSMS